MNENINQQSICTHEDELIARLAESAKAAKIQADAATQILASAMLEWLRKKMPTGTVIDLRHNKDNPLPEYLRNVTVSLGNSRGTKLFRIERIQSVQPNVTHPILSIWHAEVTPISMTTGKDMMSSAGNSKLGKREFLEIKGYFG